MAVSLVKRFNWNLIGIDASLVFAVWVCSYTISYLSLDWNIVGTREAATNIPIWGIITVTIQILFLSVFGRYRFPNSSLFVNIFVRVAAAVVLTVILLFFFQDAFKTAVSWVPRRSFVIYGFVAMFLLGSITLIGNKLNLIYSRPTTLDVGLMLLASVGSILYLGFSGVITIVGLTVSIICLSFSMRTIFCSTKKNTMKGEVVDCHALVIIIFGVALMIIAQDFEFFGLVIAVQGVAFLIRDNIKILPTLAGYVRHFEMFSATTILLGVIFVVTEVALMYIAGDFTQRTEASEVKPLTLPDEWKQQYVSVAGTKTAYYWHGKLHIQNEDGMRNVGEFIMQPFARRYIVLGDSITYGLGIRQGETYSSLLQHRLERVYPQEEIAVYNLGVAGVNSRQVAQIAERFIPKLKPERVIYGICQNDITDWYRGFVSEAAWSMPSIVSRPFASHTKIGQLMSDGYNRLLMQIGIRKDFIHDVLDNIDDSDRFIRDLEVINRLSINQTGKPVIVLVLDYAVGTNSPEHPSRKLTDIIEKQAFLAGAEVIPAKLFYDEYGDGHIPFIVSRWEGHPNEHANKIWADMFFSRLIE